MADVKKLLTELDQCNYQQRWQRIVSLVRESDDLEARNVPRALSCINSESRMLRRMATGALLNIGANDEQLEQAVHSACSPEQNALLKSIGKHNRTDMAERLVVQFKDKKPSAVARLLPACHEKTVREYLADCEPHLSRWGLLASRYPDTIFDFIRTKFAESASMWRASLWRCFEKAILTLGRLSPGPVMELFTKYCDDVERLPHRLQAMLMRMYQGHGDEVAKLLLSDRSLKSFRNRGLDSAILRHAKSLSEEHMQTLVRGLLPRSEHLVDLFRKLAPSRRRRIIESLEEQGPLESDWHQEFLEVLPFEIRQRETARILDEKKNLQKPNRLRLAALLSWDDALPVLDEESRSAKADKRAQAWGQLVRCAGVNRRMTDVLTLLQRTGNEQDPVRCTAFQMLSQTSPRAFGDEDAPLLETIIQHALDARDTSYATTESIKQLLLDLFVHNSTQTENALFRMSLQYLVKLGRRRGGMYLRNLSQVLPRGKEADLVDALADLMKSSNKNERYGMTLQIAELQLPSCIACHCPMLPACGVPVSSRGCRLS